MGFRSAVGFVILAAMPAAAQTLAGCAVFPAGNIWNTRMDGLPVDPKSATYVATIGADKPLVPDFGSGLYQGAPIGIPFIVVNATQARAPVSFDYADESDPGPYPIPRDAPIEGGPQSQGDRHVLALDRDHCVLYELFSAFPQADGSWKAGSGAVWDLSSNALRPATWTSADAAGFPIVPGLVRYDEIAAGSIRHAIRFTVPQTRREYVWPATHFASKLTGDQYPPMGQRFRLHADFDISGFAPENQVILRALKEYGMLIADNGSSWFISGGPDDRWNNDQLRELRRVHGSDFEAVDSTPIEITADSGRAVQPLPNLGNAASFVPGAVALGEIVTLMGPGYGSAGAGTTVTFAGSPALLLYAAQDQINAVVPGSVAGSKSVEVKVSMKGGDLSLGMALVAPAAPGVFGTLNQDYSINAESAPARKDSIVMIYATGDGGLPVSVRIGGIAAEILFAGPAPGFTGLLQVNARVPGGVAAGRAPVLLMAGPYASQAGACIWVR